MHLLILAVFVIAGTVLAVAWTGATAYPPRELFVAIAGVNAALVVAMAVEAREVQNRFERWIQTGVAGLVAMTLLSSLIGRSCCSRG
jgi:hypothetical protein